MSVDIKLFKRDGRWHAAVVANGDTPLEAFEALRDGLGEAADRLGAMDGAPDYEPDVDEYTEWRDYDPDC